MRSRDSSARALNTCAPLLSEMFFSRSDEKRPGSPDAANPLDNNLRRQIEKNPPLFRKRTPICLLNFFRMKFGEIQFLNGVKNFHPAAPEPEIGSLFFDSRLVSTGQHGCFFAFHSSRADGHRFIPELIEKGIRNWVVSDPDWFRRLRARAGHSVALADHPEQVLSALAALHRSRFAFPLVAIAGSNGKTIVKEWLSQLVESRYAVCKNPKSYNSRIGVPLSVWNLGPAHNLGIFEAGISTKGEMQNLADILRPDLGILTNFGPAHREGFSSEEEKYREKLLLFRHTAKLILPAILLENHRDLIHESLPETRLISWSWNQIDGHRFRLDLEDQVHDFHLPFLDQASLENLGNSISMALLLGISASEISTALPLLNQPDMRLSLKAGRYGNTLLDDTYTNEPNGLDAALQFASLQRKESRQLVLILSDMEGFSGEESGLQQFLVSRLLAYQVSTLISIGKQFAAIPLQLPGGHRNFPDLQSLMTEVSISDFHSSIILIKGSRRFGLEQLVKAWQEKVHGTCLEINLDALIHNLNFYRSRIPPGTGIMAMVKALGYGSGDEEIARLLEFHRVDYLAVAYADEGIKLREAGIRMPVMVMNPSPDSLSALFAHNLEPEIFSFRMLDALLQAASGLATETLPPIHLKVDTGMHRLGFLPEEVHLLASRLKGSGLKVATVFSHLAAADSRELSDFSRQQVEQFRNFCSQLNKSGIQGFRRHILNSAGILRFPQDSFELVRLGIGLYGIDASGDFQSKLRPVSRLKTVISQVKHIPAGASVGYGRREFLAKDSRIATLAIGYSDGFRRAFSAGALKIRHGSVLLPVIGNVCMDMCMIDISETNLEEGDEITIFETAEDIVQLALAAATIPYEILTGIGHRVKRIFYRE